MIKGDEVKPDLLSGPSVEVIPVPEASLVAFDEAYFAPCISEARLPHQGSVAEDPQTALLRNDVLRIPLHPGPRDAAEKTLIRRDSRCFLYDLHFPQQPVTNDAKGGTCL